MNIIGKNLICLLCLALATAGCDMNFGRKKVIEPAKPAAETTPSQPRPASDPKGEILATVNGQPIYMAPLHEALVDDYGFPLARQFVANEIVRQELVKRRLPVKVTPEEIAIESDKTLRIFFSLQNNQTPQQMESLLNQLLAKRQNTRRQWDATMARNVRLGRIAAGQLKITDAELKEEFYNQYDGKLKVRHIQVPSLTEAEKVLRELAKGRDFAKIAYSYSTNPSAKTGGWLPEIGTRDTPQNVPTALIRAARSLKKPGDMSNPIQVGTNFHILKLEEIIPPENVKFEDVKNQIRPDVEFRLMMQKKHELLKELISSDKTKIEYVNPTLLEKQKEVQINAR